MQQQGQPAVLGTSTSVGNGISWNQANYDHGTSGEASIASGVRKGVNLGKNLLNTKSSLRAKVADNVVHPARGTFPVEVAPFNDSEANLRERVDVLKDFGKQVQLPRNFQIPFQIDAQELLRISEEKKGAVERLNFYQWLNSLMAQYGFSPDIVNFVKQMYPEYFEEQIALIEKNLELQKRAAMLAVKVIPDSREDMEFLWAIQTGKIELPQHVAYKKGDESNDKANFRRGMLSIKSNEPTGRTGHGDAFYAVGALEKPYETIASTPIQNARFAVSEPRKWWSW